MQDFPLARIALSLFGCIEAGGTKFVCGVGTGPDDLRLTTIPTTTPDATLGKVIEFFRAQKTGNLSAVGIGAFGPIDLHPESPTFGFITSTPKKEWQNFDLAGTVQTRPRHTRRLRHRRQRRGGRRSPLGCRSRHS